MQLACVFDTKRVIAYVFMLNSFSTSSSTDSLLEIYSFMAMCLRLRI
jgi:hypothetical protein